MKFRRILMLGVLAVAMTGLPWGGDRGLAQSKADKGSAGNQKNGRMRSTTPAQRYAAAMRSAAARSEAVAQGKSLTMAVPLPGGTPDYFGIYPNYANSPLPTVGGGGVITGGIRKFVDSLPGLGAANANNLGQFIPIATKMTPPAGVPNDGDYYEIGIYDYSQQMHTDLPVTTQLRGYMDLAPGTDGKAHYLGPLIIAKRNLPVRIKFSNKLVANSSFFLPVDTGIMGAGLGPQGAGAGNYSNNRATLHLHGGDSPWISDGTPHQWVVPLGETTPYTKGMSTVNVPDMPDPGPGAMTFYYPNGQSARLMFYHDHSYGITRLNVYAGEAAGYLLTDDVEEGLINSGALPNAGGVYRYGIPLVIQDKAFVPPPAQLAAQDPTWNWGGYGNLWLPHVYMPNQNPFNDEGANAMGRWDYGPWFWPPYTGLAHGPVPNPYYPGIGQPPVIPGTPNPTIVPETFLDTPVVNGTAYPYLQVGQQAYRFRILNACNDRSLNLQLYYANPNIAPGAPGFGKEVKMVPAVETSGFPATWPTDGRDGGVPDPATAGPPIIQIGTEGGFLPAPVVIPSTPVGYNYNRRDIVVLNVSTHALLLGPAERADVIVDFSGVPAGSKLILYNDGPAPTPAFDPRYDYYTGDPDQTSTGGAPTTLPGYGPNTRTIMQFQVQAGGAGGLNLANLEAALPTAFATSQPAPIVPEPEYGPAYGKTYQTNYVRIQDTAFTYAPDAASPSTTVDLKSKAIQELFETEYGRMNAILGLEIPLTNFTNQTTIPYSYIDPPSEIIQKGDSQFWKITHNGVDTHAVHFHLFNVQLINRVGWDGAIRPPEANELGWKETVRMNPLEDAIVALRPIKPLTPFTVPNSIRPLNVTTPIGSTMGFTNIDPNGNPSPVTNQMTNFGWEYVWHCHLLGHEENDMMRPMIFANPPASPTYLTAAVLNGPTRVKLDWTSSATTETGFTIQRATDLNFPIASLVTFKVGPGVTTYVDTTIASNTTYFYRVQAYTLVGAGVTLPDYPVESAVSGFSNLAAVGPQAFLLMKKADFNGDGKEDILWRHSLTGDNAVWFMGPGTLAVGSTLLGTSNFGVMVKESGPARTDRYPIKMEKWNPSGPGVSSASPNPGGVIEFTPGKQDRKIPAVDFSLSSKNHVKNYVMTESRNGIAIQASLVRIGYAFLNAMLDQNWKIVGTGDFNGDGKLDILWQNDALRDNAVWFMDGVTFLGYVYLASHPVNWKIVGTGDFNRDGKVDILWQNNVDHTNAVWYMNGTTFLSYVFLNPHLANWKIVGTGDFNGDTKVDILWRNEATSDISVWFMDGVTLLGTSNLTAVPADLNWQIAGAGDFNGDGKADILWRHATFGYNAVWYMNGTSLAGYEYLLGVGDLNWKIVNR